MIKLVLLLMICIFLFHPPVLSQQADTTVSKSGIIQKKTTKKTKVLSFRDPGYSGNKEIIVLVIIGVVLLVLLIK